MLGVRDPRRHMLLDGLAIDRVGPPAITHASEAIAEPPDVGFGETTTAAKKKLKAEIAG
jgi:hypothetical protein